ncbi:hypothetical protein CXF91_14435 [Planococcus sp. Urea-3u-39]|nr:hypothetical protein CXF91_14435 [Planococcus sp. Urea-3u-39]
MHLYIFLEWTKNFFFPFKTRDEVEGADSGRISETIETLQERSDEAAQCEPSGKRAPATQLKSGSFSNHLIAKIPHTKSRPREDGFC